MKSKCLNREAFVVVGWTDPAGSRSDIGALLLGYYTDDSRLIYAGRASTGMTHKELKRLAGVLPPLQVPKMPLAEPHHETAASVRGSNCRAYIGFGRKWSLK